MEGMSQSAARRQLRKRPVCTFLLKEIVGILLRRAWEPRREHAEPGPLPPACTWRGPWGVAESAWVQ